jgi:transcription elongation factor Elf1
VECKMDFRAGIGSLSCRLCGASYQMPIHHLHEPVDVFSEWLDDCEAAAQGKPTGSNSAATAVGEADGVPQYESESDDDLGEASGLNAKAPVAEAASTKNGRSGKDGGSGAPSYSALGLDDSDDDSE